MRLHTPCIFSALALSIACTGKLEAPDGTAQVDGIGSLGGGDTPIVDGTQPVNPSYAVTGLRRLTTTEYNNSLRDLFGDELTLPTRLDPDQTADEGFEFRSVGASHVTTSVLGVEQYDNAARAVALELFENTTLRDRVLDCTPASATDACVETYLTQMGRRIWRRPLTDGELARYRNLTQTTTTEYGDVYKGLEIATAALLSSPNFIYRAELGDLDPSAQVRRLSDFELAGRLSYLLWQTTPDDTLLDAAANQRLSTAEGIVAEATRLIDDPRARPALVGFFTEWLGFRDLDGVPKDEAAFPDFSQSIAVSMRLEFEQVIDQYIADSALSWMSIFNTQQTYLNAELAQWYGVAGPSDDAFSPVTLAPDGPRGGLLTFGGFLTANSRATMTSPTLRGMFINQRLLCRRIPPPPPNVDPTLPPPPADGSPETMRERLARHTEDATCAGCHVPLDTPGLAFENFDATGRYRTEEFGKTIDASGELLGQTFANAREFGAILSQAPEVRQCTVRHFYRHSLATEEGPGEDPLISELTTQFETQGSSVRSLVLGLVGSDAFKLAGGLR